MVLQLVVKKYHDGVSKSTNFRQIAGFIVKRVLCIPGIPDGDERECITDVGCGWKERNSIKIINSLFKI